VTVTTAAYVVWCSDAAVAGGDAGHYGGRNTVVMGWTRGYGVANGKDGDE
jgi:hypothetical protein